MSRKGNCWDNACAESFFHSLKVELLIGEPLQNREKRERLFLNILKWTTIDNVVTVQLAIKILSSLKRCL